MLEVRDRAIIVVTVQYRTRKETELHNIQLEERARPQTRSCFFIYMFLNNDSGGLFISRWSAAKIKKQRLR